MQKDSKEIFLYGLSLPTVSNNFRQSKANNLYYNNEKTNVIIYESINPDIKLQDIIDKNQIIFNKINKNIDRSIIFQNQSTAIQYVDNVVPEKPISPLDSLVTMNIFYTDEVFEFNNNYFLQKENIGDIKKILMTISNDKQNFMKNYTTRLGCFEFASTQNWAEKNNPFDLCIDKNKKQFVFTKTNYSCKITMHIIGYLQNNDIIFDKLFTVDLNDNKLEISFNDIALIERLEYWLFDETGANIHHENNVFIKKINGNINILEDTINIIDSMSKRDSKTQKVQTYTSSSFEVSLPENKKAIQSLNYRCNIQNIIREITNKEESGKWFKKSDNMLHELIAYINGLMNVEFTNITIIDPFFSKASLELLSRLNNLSLAIKIISCWQSTDPDTEEIKEIEIIKKEIIEAMKRLKPTKLPVSKIQWYNLKKEKFHDRYIIINNTKSKEYKIYILSNSINNLLKKYDFCILQLYGEIKICAKEYIDKLLVQCNSETEILC